MSALCRARLWIVAGLVAASLGAAAGPCLAMGLAHGTDSCTMPHAERGHCAPKAALGPGCCHASTAPVPADAPVAPLASVPAGVVLLWSAVPGPAALPVVALQPASPHALVLGSPPLFLQHRVLLI